MSLANLDSLYQYWFNPPIRDEPEYLNERLPIWFLKNPEADRYIRERFSPLLESYVKGNVNFDSGMPREVLGMVILLDQVPRNSFRQTAKAHEFDSQALTITKEAIKFTLDKSLHPLENLFLYMPLQHSENLEDQKISLRQFAQLEVSAPAPLKSFLSYALEMAHRHYHAIEKFGRFPHRNTYLKRSSSVEEMEYLKDPKNSF